MENNQLMQGSIFDPLIPHITEISWNKQLVIRLPNDFQIDIEQVKKYFERYDHYVLLTWKVFEGTLRDDEVFKYIFDKVLASGRGYFHFQNAFKRAQAPASYTVEFKFTDEGARSIKKFLNSTDDAE